jgi:ABC-type branched-subunit amino acid transport system substrate-binding protein
VRGLLAVVLIGSLVLAGCAPGFPSTGSWDAARWRGIIKVGLVAPFSGPTTSDGTSLLRGAQQAARDLNAGGGIDGYRLEVLAADEQTAVTPAALAADPDVVAVIGHLGPAPAAAAVYRQAGLAWLATTPLDPATAAARAPGPPAYPLVASGAAVDRAAATFLVQDAGVAATAAPSALAQCRGAIDHGGGMVAVSSAVGVSPVQLLCGAPPASWATALANLRPGQRLLGVEGGDAPEVARWWKAGTLDATTVVPSPRLASPVWQRLAAEAHLSPTDRGSAWFGLGYDGTELTAKAVARAVATGPPTRAAIAAQLRQSDWVGAVGASGPAGVQQASVAILEVAAAAPPTGAPIRRMEEQASSPNLPQVARGARTTNRPVGRWSSV